MLNRSDVKRIVADLYRAELARWQPEALAVCNGTAEDLWAKIPLDIKQKADEKAAILFGYAPRSFSLFERLIDYSYASFLQKQQLSFIVKSQNAEPVRRIHTVDMMWREARELTQIYENVQRVVALVPASHWYGFTFTVELPHLLQVPVISLPASPAQNWNTLLKPGDLLIATPLFWNYWLRCGNHFPAQVQAISATATCKNEFMQGLLAAGASAVYDVYGCSQMGALGWRRAGEETFHVFSFWQTHCGSEGLWYAQHAAGTDQIEFPGEIETKDGQNFHLLPHGETCVQIAGQEVYLRRVERVIAAHPAVASCRVQPVDTPEGAALEARLALKEGYTPEQIGIIRSFLSQHLSTPEIPHSFKFDLTPTSSGLNTPAAW